MTIRNDATRERIVTTEKRGLRSVVARQGQVLLDTDLNGLAGLTLDRIETADADIIGAPGRLAVPVAAPGFALSGIAQPGGALDCSIGPGRGYLDGWLVENVASFTLAATSGAGAQPHPWACPPIALPAIVGLKALARLIDPVEDSVLADRAMGDAQASGRSIVDWQAFVLPVPAPAASAPPLTCADVPALAQWQALVRPSTGTLRFIKADPAPSTDPCSLSESGGYTRLENLLYRVEVHRGQLAPDAPDPVIDGPRYSLDGLQLKLSRCNASTLVRVDQVSGRIFKVSPARLDPLHWFVEGQLAELVSIHDDVDLASGHATERLFRVARVAEDEVELVDRSGTDTVAAVGATSDGTWFLRMWECMPDGKEVATVALEAGGTRSTVMDLGDGIAIQLEGDAQVRFRPGDYWTCAMRADGEIEWSDDAFERPAGPERRYAPLALVNAGAAAPVVEDCRITLATLADRVLLYRGGDGQEAKPDPTQPAQRVPLASPVRVAVMRGENPVVGAKVTFALKDLPAGKAALLGWQPASGPQVSGASVIATTDAQGLAEVHWEIDPTVPQQWVEATLETAPGRAAATPLRFTANLSVANAVGFDPKSIAIFAGITDVQRALEALAGMQQAGCATYVLTPENWLDVLAGLKPGEDAKLCLQRGVFKTGERVVLKGLGHIGLCGAGEASLVTVEKGECALQFENCASVHVCSVAVSAMDGVDASSRGPHVEGRGGTLTMIGCGEVEVADTLLACGGQAVTERTCLTVRGSAKRPTSRVRIANNRISAGFMQDGILVVDAEHCLIADNILAPAALPEKLDKERVLLGKGLQPALMRALVPGKAIARAAATGAISVGAPDMRLLRAGAFSASFSSPIPQSEWDGLVAATPPSAEETASSEAFSRYVDRVFSAASENRTLVDRFAPAVRRLERADATALTPALRVAMLRASAVRVSDQPAVVTPSPAPAASGAAITISGLPKFRSALTENGWGTLLSNVPVSIEAADPAATTTEKLLKAARMALADRSLRRKVPGLQKFFEEKAEAITPFGRQAITVGGEAVGDAIVTGNQISGFAQAVHVGASARYDKDPETSSTIKFRTVTVTANLAALHTMGDLAYAPAGIFVGNARTIRIADNLVTAQGQEAEDRNGKDGSAANIGDGIRVWGVLGRFVAIEKNRVAVGNRCAIRIRPISIPDHEVPRYMWLVADNLSDIHSAIQVVRAPSFVERRYNKPG